MDITKHYLEPRSRYLRFLGCGYLVISFIQRMLNSSLVKLYLFRTLSHQHTSHEEFKKIITLYTFPAFYTNFSQILKVHYSLITHDPSNAPHISYLT